jgi:hypothetical protein
MTPVDRPPVDDRLLERLAALGPVLDRLTSEADVDRGRGGGGRERPPARRRVLAAAAAIVLLVVGAIGIVAVTSDDGGDAVVADQGKTTTTIESDAALRVRVADRVLREEGCGPLPTRDQIPAPWPKDWEMVGSPDCDTAYVQDPGKDRDPVPVYVEPKVTEPVAYWSEDTGWIDLAEYRSPTFDLARYRAAYQAAVKAKRTPTGN